MRRIDLVKFLLVVGLFFSTATQAWSQQVDTPGKKSKPTIQDLIRRLDAYEAELKLLRSERSDSMPTRNVTHSVTAEEAIFDNDIKTRLTSIERVLDGKTDADKGVDTSKEKFNVKVGGRIMYDGTWGTDDGLDQTSIGQPFENGHEFRRLRLFASGKGYGIFSYKVQLDFSAGNGSPDLKDVYIGASDLPIGNVWIGHFKEPFSLEELTSSKYITFIERSLPNAMAPARSMGVMLFDSWADGRGTWEIGTFFDDLQQTSAEDDGNNDNSDMEHRSFNARVTRLLCYDEPTDGRYLAHVGSSFRWVDAERRETMRFRARPEVHDTFRFLGVSPLPTDDYYQWGAEAAGVWGPFSVQGEYIATHFNTDGPNTNLWGAYAYASYFLTGEHRPYSHSRGSFGRVKPNENCWWVETCDGDTCCGHGAWELVARWSTLDYSDSNLTGLGGSSGTRGKLWNTTLGVNWYWNPYMRLMFNYVHSELDDSVLGREVDLDAFMMRTQIDF